MFVYAQNYPHYARLICLVTNHQQEGAMTKLTMTTLMIDSPTDQVKKLVATELITKVVDLINVYSKTRERYSYWFQLNNYYETFRWIAQEENKHASSTD